MGVTKIVSLINTFLAQSCMSVRKSGHERVKPVHCTCTVKAFAHQLSHIQHHLVVPKAQHYPFFFLSQHKRRKGGLASETSLPLDYTAHAATPDRYL